MFRNHVTARLSRYRYEIAAAIFLTIAALVLLAAAAWSLERSLSNKGSLTVQSVTFGG